MFPFETAPKNREILAIDKNAASPSWSITRWHKGEWETVDWDSDGYIAATWHNPTHWADLPTTNEAA